MKKEFKINVKIYPEVNIRQSIEDFKDAWEIFYDKWILTISWEDEDDIKEVFNEFMNYIIWLINE